MKKYKTTKIKLTLSFPFVIILAPLQRTVQGDVMKELTALEISIVSGGKQVTQEMTDSRDERSIWDSVGDFFSNVGDAISGYFSGNSATGTGSSDFNFDVKRSCVTDAKTGEGTCTTSYGINGHIDASGTVTVTQPVLIK